MNTRRDFLEWSALAVAGMAKARADVMPVRSLGRTGYKTCLFSLGGQAAVERPNNEAVAVAIVERALDLGVNYIDTSSIYGGPERWSERYIGKVMAHRRNQVFLASKTKERTRDASLRMLDESLRLLQTDHLDLWQLHDIGTDGDIEAVFARGGAMEALTRARDQKKMVRHLGITGHYRPEPLMEGIRRFPFEAILLAANAADHYHFGFAERLIPFAVEKNMGIIGMKVTARGRLLSTWTPPPTEDQAHSWEGAVIATRPGTLTVRQAMHFSLSLPLSTVIIGCDSVDQVEENVRLARAFKPLSAGEMKQIEAKAEPVAKQGLFFRFVPR